jgi:GDPmannose 4,6-dehydratase
VKSVVEEVRPSEIYNLGAQSAVNASWDLIRDTYETNLIGPLSILEALKGAGLMDNCRVLQVSSTSMRSYCVELCGFSYSYHT